MTAAEIVAVARLCGQRAVFAADSSERNKLACREIRRSRVFFGHIVQRQRHAAVALVVTVERPAGQILVCRTTLSWRFTVSVPFSIAVSVPLTVAVTRPRPVVPTLIS